MSTTVSSHVTLTNVLLLAAVFYRYTEKFGLVSIFELNPISNTCYQIR